VAFVVDRGGIQTEDLFRAGFYAKSAALAVFRLYREFCHVVFCLLLRRIVSSEWSFVFFGMIQSLFQRIFNSLVVLTISFYDSARKINPEYSHLVRSPNHYSRVLAFSQQIAVKKREAGVPLLAKIERNQ